MAELTDIMKSLLFGYKSNKVNCLATDSKKFT
jgi:hypothetical protein